MADIFVKDEGLFRPVRRLYVNREGQWTNIKEAWVKEAGTWRSVYKAPTELNVVLDANFWHSFYNVPKVNGRARLGIFCLWQNVNVKTLLMAKGWDGISRVDATITHYIRSWMCSTDPNIPALLFPSDLPAGSKIHLKNGGYIFGAGGIFVVNNSLGESGGGGCAIQVSCNDCVIQITNYGVLSTRNLAHIAGGGGAGGRGGGVGIPQLDNSCLIYNGGNGGRGTAEPKDTVPSTSGFSFTPTPGAPGKYLKQERVLVPDIDEEQRLSGEDLESILSPTESLLRPAVTTGRGGNGGKIGQPGSPGAPAKINQNSRYFQNNPFPFCAQIAPTAGGPAGRPVIGNDKITWLERGNLLGSPVL